MFFKRRLKAIFIFLWAFSSSLSLLPASAASLAPVATSTLMSKLKRGAGYYIKSVIALTPTTQVFQRILTSQNIVNTNKLGADPLSAEYTSLIVKILQDLKVNPKDIKMKSMSKERAAEMLKFGCPIWVHDTALWLNESYLTNELTTEEREAALNFYGLQIKQELYGKQAVGALVVPVGTFLGTWGLANGAKAILKSANNANVSPVFGKITEWTPYLITFCVTQMLINNYLINQIIIKQTDNVFKEYASRGYNLLALKTYFEKMTLVSGSSAFKKHQDKIDTLIYSYSKPLIIQSTTHVKTLA